MRKFVIEKCPFCGGHEFDTGYQNNEGRIISIHSLLKSSNVYHFICLDCGSIVHSFVEDVEKFRNIPSRFPSKFHPEGG